MLCSVIKGHYFTKNHLASRDKSHFLPKLTKRRWFPIPMPSTADAIHRRQIIEHLILHCCSFTYIISNIKPPDLKTCSGLIDIIPLILPCSIATLLTTLHFLLKQFLTIGHRWHSFNRSLSWSRVSVLFSIFWVVFLRSSQATRTATDVRRTSAASATLTSSCCRKRICGRRCRNTRRHDSGCWRRVVRCWERTTSSTKKWQVDRNWSSSAPMRNWPDSKRRWTRRSSDWRRWRRSLTVSSNSSNSASPRPSPTLPSSLPLPQPKLLS